MTSKRQTEGLLAYQEVLKTAVWTVVKKDVQFVLIAERTVEFNDWRMVQGQQDLSLHKNFFDSIIRLQFIEK